MTGKDYHEKITKERFHSRLQNCNSEELKTVLKKQSEHIGLVINSEIINAIKNETSIILALMGHGI